MPSIQRNYLPCLQGSVIAQRQKPVFKTSILSVAATLKLTYHRSSRARARTCGATSQRAWSALQKKNVLRRTLHPSCRPNPLHRHRCLQFLVAAFYRFNRNFAIFNPALAFLLERARQASLATASPILLMGTAHLNRSGCACLSSTPAATSCLPPIRSL